MSEYAIEAFDLSKRYMLGQSVGSYGTLRDVISRALFGRTQATGTLPNREFWALDDVSFKVREGEVVGFIGHNGSGKSTLLKILSRIVQPTRGRATIAGRVSALLEVGTGFHHELTGRENVFVNS